MEIENINETNVCVNENGKISFAPDVIATIANLAASEVAGVTGLGGGFADSISGILNSKKNYTKGVRVEVGNEEAVIVESHGIASGPVLVLRSHQTFQCARS